MPIYMLMFLEKEKAVNVGSPNGVYCEKRVYTPFYRGV